MWWARIVEDDAELMHCVYTRRNKVHAVNRKQKLNTLFCAIALLAWFAPKFGQFVMIRK